MRALVERGWRVIAATAPGDTRSGLEDEGVEVVDVPFRRGGFSARDASSLRALRCLYHEVSPQLVHHFNAKPIVYGGLVARGFSRTRVVHTVTGLGHAFARQGLSRLGASAAYRLTGPRADAVVFQNCADREVFVHHGWVHPARAHLILSSGVDLDRFGEPARQASEVETVLMVARLLWGKGVGEFVEAARILRRRGHCAPLILGGEWEPEHPDGVDRDYLRAAESEGAITFRGYVVDMPAALDDTAVFVAPSYYPEGVPRVLLEAAASHRPVVAADAAGAREVVRHEETGLLVPRGDPVTLADAIEVLLEHPKQRAVMGEAAHHHVASRFSLQAVTQQHLQIYRDLGLLDAEDCSNGPPEGEG